MEDQGKDDHRNPSTAVVAPAAGPRQLGMGCSWHSEAGPPPHTHTLPHHPRPCFSRCGEPRENRLQLEPRHLDSALMEVAPTGVEGSEFCIPGAGAGGWNSQFSE